MASNFEVTNGKLKITFWWQADTAKVQAIIEKASELLYADRGFENIYDGEGELIPWDTLTNQQQLVVVERYLKITVLGLANSKKEHDASTLAIETEQADLLDFDED